MKKLAPQTKSFIILFAIAIIGSYACMLAANKLRHKSPEETVNTKQQDLTQIVYTQKAQAAESEPTADTTDWKTYTNEKYGFSFKYKPDWQVKAAAKKDGFDVIEIDPGKKFYNIKIYIGKNGFFAMDSLPFKEVKVNGVVAQDVSDMLYGFKTDDYYFTFDLGLSVSLKPEFNGLIRSVTFAQ